LRSEPRFRPARAALLVLALLAPRAGAVEVAENGAAPTVEQVKAAYLVNFLRYTEWPANRFASADSPYVACLVGADGVAEELTDIAARLGAIDGRPLEVRRYRTDKPGTAAHVRLVEALEEAHVVFVGEDVEDAGPLLRDLERREILTVGDEPEFAAAGGMIGLRREGNRVVFDANPEAIRGTGLLVSARVLKLARIVGRSVP
jgi:hypothetical protein